MSVMEQRLIPLLLLSGFLAVILCGSSEYILIPEFRSWAEARDYCQQNHVDLATVQTDEDWIQLHQLRERLQFYIWIGLYDDMDSWRWSFQDKDLKSNFLHWDFDQPNNLDGRQFCVTLRSSGFWWDEDCNLTCPFFCQSADGKPVLVTDPETSWNKAQEYCRKNYTDLLTIRNASVNEQLTLMIEEHACAWIGLFRDSWKWLNQSPAPPFSSLPWAAEQPDNSMGQESCAALDFVGQIADERCSKLYYFLCQTVRLKQQVLRLEVKAGNDVSDAAVTAAVLNQVQQKLKEQGMAADVKVSWRVQPDGMVFQKMKDGSTGVNEEL